jgi:hypothetical protein
MGSIATASLNQMLDAYVGSTTYTANAAFYVQLHTGSPGVDGTSNIASETTRQAVTFGSAASSGAVSNTADVTWSSVSDTETYTDVSFWTASSGGTYLGQDTLSASASMTAGDTFEILTGDLDLTLT